MARQFLCAVFKKDNEGRWVPHPEGWAYDRVIEDTGHGTQFKVNDLTPGDYQILRMEWYDTHGSGHPRSYFVRVTEIPARKTATELSLAQAEYGASL